MIKKLALGSALFLSACVNVETFANIIVHDHPGGPISETIHETRSIQIRGRCMSSCTFYLGAEDVCVTPDSVLGFHGISWNILSILHKDGIEPAAQHLPENMRDDYINDWGQTLEFTYFTGQELHDIYGVELCEY